MNRLKKDRDATDSWKAYAESFGSINTNWVLNLTDGKISHLNSLADAIIHLSLSNDRKASDLSALLSAYFYRISSQVHLFLDSLSYVEKLLMDRIALAPSPFRISDISTPTINTSSYIKTLHQKRIIDYDEKEKDALYRLSVSSVKCWLRFYKQCDLSKTLNPSKKVAQT